MLVVRVHGSLSVEDSAGKVCGFTPLPFSTLREINTYTYISIFIVERRCACYGQIQLYVYQNYATRGQVSGETADNPK